MFAGYLYSAQRKWRNGENNRLGLGLGRGIGLGSGLGLGLGIEFDYFRHCAICVAPFVLRQIQKAMFAPRILLSVAILAVFMFLGLKLTRVNWTGRSVRCKGEISS